MTKPITPEMSAAWRTLQAAAKGAYRLQPDVRDAINVLDNSDFMVPVEDAELETTPSAPALDPAEWGDTTREDIARRQSAAGE